MYGFCFVHSFVLCEPEPVEQDVISNESVRQFPGQLKQLFWQKVEGGGVAKFKTPRAINGCLLKLQVYGRGTCMHALLCTAQPRFSSDARGLAVFADSQFNVSQNQGNVIPKSKLTVVRVFREQVRVPRRTRRRKGNTERSDEAKTPSLLLPYFLFFDLTSARLHMQSRLAGNSPSPYVGTRFCA